MTAFPTYTSATSPSPKDSRRVKCCFSVPVISRRCEKALLRMKTEVKHSAYPIAAGPGTQNLTTSITTAYRRPFKRPDLSEDRRTFGRSYKSSAPLTTHSFQVCLPPGPGYSSAPNCILGQEVDTLEMSASLAVPSSCNSGQRFFDPLINPVA